MKHFVRSLASIYSPQFPAALVYMLQSTEYQARPYLAWFWRTSDFSLVMRRRQLDLTRVARLLLLALQIAAVTTILAAALVVWWGYWQFGLALLLAYPILLAHAAVLPLELGRLLVVRPREAKLIARSEHIFRSHKGEKIAIAGSYGKTSMKELLLTVLSEGKKVAATPANKNVAISHAIFAAKLTGDEDVVIIEYGEGAPGDVARFSATTHPTRAVITGIAPAHLDQYKNLDQAAQDIFSVSRYVAADRLYVNGDSLPARPYLNDEYATYSSHGALGWKVTNIRITLEQTSFSLVRGKQTLRLTSGLVGRHQVGPLAFAATLGLELGLTPAQVETGIAATVPYEHRMKPYPLAGAWIIDDTYNGNIEGIRAGTALLKELPAARKLYVTPGLVDQGPETERVHLEMGRLIADAAPNKVVLMQNSVASFIRHGLEKAGYQGEISVVHDPLAFYTNLNLVVAAGDVVLLQNDWTDNYH